MLVGDGRVSRHFVDRQRVDVNRMELASEYPYQWSNTDGKIKHWCFFLPVDERTTRVFFLFYFDALRFPLTLIAVPRWLMRPLLSISNWLLIRPLLMQDGAMVEAEQRAYEAKPEAPTIERNPAVIEFQKLIVENGGAIGAAWRRPNRPAWRRPLPDGCRPRRAVDAAALAARTLARRQGADGAWEGEVVWCPIITAEVVLMDFALAGRSRPSEAASSCAISR